MINISKSGDIYDGSLLSGAFEGQGKLTFKVHKTFRCYDGAWIQGTFDGQGNMTYTSEEIYKGAWKNGKRNGVGFHTFIKASPNMSYKGEWAEDQFEGIGVLVSSKGTALHCEFKAGQANGLGNLFDKAGKSTQRGKWKDGDFVEKNKSSEEAKLKEVEAKAAIYKSTNFEPVAGKDGSITDVRFRFYPFSEIKRFGYH